jgi:hypothetical protein
MAISYIKIFQSKTVQNLPKLEFLVWKQTIWQPWCGAANLIRFYWLPLFPTMLRQQLDAFLNYFFEIFFFPEIHTVTMHIKFWKQHCNVLRHKTSHPGGIGTWDLLFCRQTWWPLCHAARTRHDPFSMSQNVESQQCLKYWLCRSQSYNPTMASYNASVVNFYNATGSLALL